MKRVSSFLLLVVFILTLTAFLSACGGGGGGGGSTPPSNPVNTTVTAPTTTTSAQQAASTGSQGANMGTGSATTFQNFGQIGLSSTVGAVKLRTPNVSDAGFAHTAKLSAKLAKSQAVSKAVASLRRARSLHTVTTIPSTTSACTDGGSITFSGSYDDVALSYNLTMDSTACREDGMQTDGSITLTGTDSASGVNFTMVLGSASNTLQMLEYSDSTYSVLMTKMESAITMTESGTYDSTTGAFSLSDAANGTMSVLDYFNSETYSMTFSNLAMTMSDTVNATSGAETFSVSMDGGVSEEWTDTSGTQSVAMSFVAFTVSDVYASTSSVAYAESLSGKFGINFTPDSCFEGGYEFQTITPVQYTSTGTTTAGHLKINSVVDVVYNGDGTITVSLNGVQIFSGDEYDIASICEFQTLDEPAPVSSGSTGTSSGSITATLTWNSPNSDMDLHLVHLTSAPSGTVDTYSSSITDYTGVTTNTDWHLYYGTGPGGACSSGNYIGTATSPIATLDIDDCSGYGPEHITMDTPQSGYYLLFVNSYSMSGDPSTTVTVSLQVGGSVFTFPTYTFTTSGSGVNYSVCSFTVDASGNVTVGTPASVSYAPRPGLTKAAF